MPGSSSTWDDFVKESLEEGYTLEALHSGAREALPQIFKIAKENNIPFSEIRARLTSIGLPAEIWKDPATLSSKPDAEEAPYFGIPAALGKMLNYGSSVDPDKRGPTDPEMTSVFKQIAERFNPARNVGRELMDLTTIPHGPGDPKPTMQQALQAIGQLLLAPGRGYQGALTGLANIPSGSGKAWERAAAATRPGFQPEGIGEGAAAIAGPMIGDLALGMTAGAPIRMAASGAMGAGEAALAGAGLRGVLQSGIAVGTGAASMLTPPLGAGLIASAAEGAGVGAIFGVLQSMAATGQVDAEDVEVASKMGLGLGAGIHAGAGVAGAAWARLAPAVKGRIKIELKNFRSGTADQPGFVPLEVMEALRNGTITVRQAAKASFDRVKGLLTPKPKPQVPVDEGIPMGAKSWSPEELAAAGSPEEALARAEGRPAPAVAEAGAVRAQTEAQMEAARARYSQNPLRLAAGQEVTLVGGPLKPGATAKIVGWAPASERYVVDLPSGRRIYTKPGNVRLKPGQARMTRQPPAEIAAPPEAPGVPGEVPGVPPVKPEQPPIPPNLMGRKVILDRQTNEINQALAKIDAAEVARGKTTQGDTNQRRRLKTQMSRIDAERRKLGLPQAVEPPTMPQERPGGPVAQVPAEPKISPPAPAAAPALPEKKVTPQIPAPAGSTPLGVTPRRKGPIWPGAEEPVVAAPKATPEPAVPTEVKSVPEIPEPVAGHPPSQFSMAAMTVEDFYLKHDKILSAKQVFELIEDKSGPLQFVDDFLQTFGKKKMRASAWADILNAKKAELEKAETSPTAPISAPPAAAPAISPVGPQAAPTTLPRVPRDRMVNLITKEAKAKLLADADVHAAKAKPDPGRGDPGIVEVLIGTSRVKVRNTKEGWIDFRARVKAQLSERALLGPERFDFQSLAYMQTRAERFDPLVTVNGGKGWITDGRLIVAGEATGGKFSGDRSVTFENLKATIDKEAADATPAELLYYAAQGDSFQGVSPVPVVRNLGGSADKPAMVIFKDSEGRYTAYDQLRHTAIVNRHPDAEYFVGKGGALVAKVNGKPVAVLAPLRADAGGTFWSEPPLAGEAREARLLGRGDKPDQLADMAEVPGTPDDMLRDVTDIAPGAENPPLTPDERRTAFSLTMLRRVDPIRLWDSIVEFRTKLGLPVSVTFEEYKGKGLRGSYYPMAHRGGTGEAVITQDWHNIGTAIHEILGHGLDDALGTIKTESKFPLSNRIGVPGNNLVEEDLRRELRALSKYVDPYLPQGWTPYRERHPELFSRFMMALVVDRQLAEQIAPKFTGGWLENLKRHPAVAEAVEPFLRATDNPIMKLGFLDRKVEDVGRAIVDHIKGVDLDPGVTNRRYTLWDWTKDELRSAYNFVATPLMKAARDPIFKQAYDQLQGYSYATSRRENIGLNMAKLKEFEALPHESQQRVVKAIRELDNPKAQRYLKKEEVMLGDHALTEQEADAYVAMSKAVKYATRLTIAKVRKLNNYENATPERRAQIDAEIHEDMLTYGHYFPIMRYGEHAVFGRAAEDESKIWFNFYETEAEAAREANRLIGLGYLNVGKYPRTKLPEEFWKTYGNKLSGHQLEVIFDVAKVDRANPEIMKLSDKIGKLRLRDLMHRNWVPGYPHTPENLVKSIESYVFHAAKSLSKMEAEQGARRVLLSQVDRFKNPVQWDDIARYIRTFKDSGEAEHSMLRKWLYAWELGGKFSFFVNNSTQTIQTTWNEVARYAKGFDPEVIMGRAYRDAAKVMARTSLGGEYDTRGFSPLKRYVIRRLDQEGVLPGQWTEEMLELRKMPLRNRMSKAWTFFGQASEQGNRLVTALAALEVAERQGLSRINTLNFTRDFIHKTQYAFGPANLPAFIADSGSWQSMLRLLYTFHSYSFHTVDRVAQQWTRDPQMAVLARQALGMLGLAGMSGPPGAALAMWGAWYFGGMDVPTEIRKKFKEKEWIADLITGGTPGAALGIDTRRSLGLGDFVPTPRVGQSAAAVFGETIAAAPGTEISRLKRGINLARKGDYRRAIENVTPRAVASAFEAARVANEGLTFPSGEVLIPKEKITKGQIAAKSLGFQPLEWSKAYEKLEAKKRLEIIRSDRTRGYVERIARARRNQDSQEEERIWEEIAAHNTKAYSKGRMRDVVKPSQRAIRDHYDKLTGAGSNLRIKRTPKILREDVREIEGL